MSPEQTMKYGQCDSPVGRIRYGHVDNQLCHLRFLAARSTDLRVKECEFGRGDIDPHTGIEGALASYFSGDSTGVDNWPILYQGTAFQLAVWKTLRRLPFGQTITYGELARSVGKPSAARAIGMAMAANPTPLFVPCHRVLAAGGKIGGFSPGVDLKRRLLIHEGVWPESAQLSLKANTTEFDHGVKA